MPIANFEQLCKHVCEVAGVEVPTLTEDDSGITAFTIQLGESRVSVMQHREMRNAVMVACILGTLPEPDDALACRRLMELNHMSIGVPGSPTASRNPVTGEFVLHFAQGLDDASGSSIYETVKRMASLASEWRSP